MNLHDWLEAERGRASWLAEELGRSKTAVSLWRTEGVPLPLIPKVAALTDGSVSENELLRHAMECKVLGNEHADREAA